MDPGSFNIPTENHPSTSEQEATVPGVRRLRSGIVSRSSYQLLACKSPSTDSTTSLAQLRDRLTVFDKRKYDKSLYNPKFSSDLPVLQELDEKESLSNSVTKTKRSEVALKYHSDSEAQGRAIRKEVRCPSPVVDKQSASLFAALGNTEQSVTNNIFEKLYSKNRNIDLADLLVVEALQHGQEKDMSGKVTQDSDVVENTPVEKRARHKKLGAKRNDPSIVQDKLPIVESETDVIEGTPCYVNDRKRIGRTNSTKAVNKEITHEIVTSNETVANAFFSQHANQYNTENIVSPTLARKINDTSSETSDDDCIIIEDDFMRKGCINDIAIEKDINECVKSMVDKVCHDLDKYDESLTEQQRQIDSFCFAKNIDYNPKVRPDISTTSNDKLKSGKYTSYEHNTKEVAPKMSTRKKTKLNKDPTDKGKGKYLKENTNSSSPINPTKTAAIRIKRKLYSPKDDENDNNSIPKGRVERRQSNNSQTSIAACYRELENARKSRNSDLRKSRESTRAKRINKVSRYRAYSDAEDPPFEIRKSTRMTVIETTPTKNIRERLVKPVNYIDTYYSTLSSSSASDDFGHNRVVKPNTVKKKKPKSRKAKKESSTRPVLSPKTSKLDEIFDNIRDNVVNEEKIMLVEKKSCKKDLSLYNLSSESEDEHFKKKMIQVRKRASSSSLDVSATKRRRSVTHVNYSERYSSEDECKSTKKSKTIRQAKPRSRQANTIPKTNLIDERMRTAQQETLETSFVIDTVDVNNLNEPEPLLQQPPALEVMPSDKLTNDVNGVSENKTQTPSKLKSKLKQENKSKKCVKLTRSTVTKKGQENITNVLREKDSGSVSPLPGLLVETEGTRKDDLTSSMEANLLQKFRNIYTDVHNLNGSDDRRSLLSDPDDNAIIDSDEIIETVLKSDLLPEITIATGGSSPIRAHNDLNEPPPNIESLNENYPHRDVHNESVSESVAEFLTNMKNQLHMSRSISSQTFPVFPVTRSSTKESARSIVSVKKRPSAESVHKSISYAESNNAKVKRMPREEIESNLDPVGTPKSKDFSVVLTRMSSEEIEKYLTPSNTKTTSGAGTPKIVLKRISSDEINRWLPMPQSKVKDTEEKPKKTDSVVERNIKPRISPVKLDFDVDLTTADDGRVTRAFRTRCHTKSMKSHAASISQADSINSSSQTSKNNEHLIGNSQQTNKTSDKAISRLDPTSVDPSNMNNSIASVHDWFKRSVTPSSTPAAANHGLKEMICQVLERLETTLTEIHQGTGERFTDVFMKFQQEITCLKKEIEGITDQHTLVMNRLEIVREELEQLKMNLTQRASEVIHDDVQKKTTMIKLLQEDLMGIIN